MAAAVPAHPAPRRGGGPRLPRRAGPRPHPPVLRLLLGAGRALRALPALDRRACGWRSGSGRSAPASLLRDERAPERGAPRPGRGRRCSAGLAGGVRRRSPPHQALRRGLVALAGVRRRRCSSPRVRFLRQRPPEPDRQAFGSATSFPARAAPRGRQRADPVPRAQDGLGWNMYANLRTVDGETNHYVVPRTVPLTDAQDDLVDILDSDDPALLCYRDNDYSLTWLQLRAYLSDHPDTRIRYRRGNATVALAHASDDPELVEPVPLGRRSCSSSGPSTSESPERCVPRSGRPAERTLTGPVRSASVASTTVPPFQMVSDFAPAGDQPTADRRAHREHQAGRPVPDPPRHHRVGQERHDRLDDRAGAAAHARAGPQQVAGRPARQRVPRVLPAQPRGVLRLLLRLLPTRGLHRLERHLHREGLVGERRDRPAAPRRHLGPAHPARRDRGGLGVVHLRPRLARGVPQQHAPPPGGRRRSTSAACSASSSTCATSATT